MLENISIILVEPQGDENIGMTARAIKNCGISKLRLVNPVPFKTYNAKKWACNAWDLLSNAKVFSDLKHAVYDASFVVGTSCRQGKLRPPSLSYKESLIKIYKHAKSGHVALVFGRETDGLNRKELDLCDVVFSIPTSSLYPSLNLAQAVLIVCHEIYKTYLVREKKLKKRQEKWPLFVSREEILPALDKLDCALRRLGYDNRDNGKLRKKIIKGFSDLFGRGGLRKKDLNMFIGLSARIMEKVKE